MTGSVFIGRFQPFHNGHQERVEYCLDRYDNLYMGLGISEEEDNNERRTFRNPLTYGERKQTIQGVYPKVPVFGVRDQGDPELWIEEVEKQVSDYLEKDDFVAVTGNDYTAYCFQKAGYDVDFLEGGEENKEISGTHIRELASGGEKWRVHVPDPAAEILEELEFEDIMDELS